MGRLLIPVVPRHSRAALLLESYGGLTLRMKRIAPSIVGRANQNAVPIEK